MADGRHASRSGVQRTPAKPNRDRVSDSTIA